MPPLSNKLGGPSSSSDESLRTHLRPALSVREVEVLRHWLRSDSKLTVATNLNIGLGTVNTHLTRIREKYALVGRDATTKSALLIRALHDEIISIAEF